MVEKIALLFLGAVVLTPLADWARRGTRRSRLRHRLNEEIALVEKLGDWPEAQECLKQRIGKLLAMYEPPAQSRQEKPTRFWFESARFMVIAVLLASPLLFVVDSAHLSRWAVVANGVVAGVVTIVLLEWWDHRSRRGRST